MVTLLPTRVAGAPLCAGQVRLGSARPQVRQAVRYSRTTRCSASPDEHLQAQLVKTAAFSSAIGSFLAAGNASAAQELADLAVKTDNRFGIIAALGLPVVGWAGFNILGPALNQLNNMKGSKPQRARGLAAGLGMSLASLLVAHSASAASEVADLAVGKDNRTLIIAVVFLPAVGWVGFNILGPALNQLNNMGGDDSKGGRRKRGIAGAVGLAGASLLGIQQADAASEVAQLAERDNRIGVVLLLLLPILGWAGFNILGPALNQLEQMKGSSSRTSRR